MSYTAFGVLALRVGRRVRRAGDGGAGWSASQNGDGGFGVARASTERQRHDRRGAPGARRGRTAPAAARAQRAVSLAAREPERRRRLRPVQGARLERAVDLLRDPGARRRRRRRRHALARARATCAACSAATAASRYSSSSAQTPVWVTAQALMALERKPLPIAAVREEQADAREGGHRRVGRRSSGARRRRQGRLQDGQAAPAPQPRAARARAAAGDAAAGAVAGATAATEPDATNPESTSALAAASKSGAAHPKPVPVWAALRGGAGPGRAPVGAPAVRAARTLAWAGIVRA